MLTGDLVRARVRGPAVTPSWIKVDDAGLLGRASELIDLLKQAAEEGWARGELDEAVFELCGDRRDPKVIRGLAKLLTDKATFAEESPISPAELRRAAFLKARELGPLALGPNPFGYPTADAIFAHLAPELSQPAETLREALYADLPSAQRVQTAPDYEPEALLQRYNVALAQAVLLRASKLSLHLGHPEAPRLRQLLRWVKFHRLLFVAERQADALILTLDGPLSLFSQSTRYGMQLANFLPALLLQPGPWRLEAEVQWGPKRLNKVLTLTHADALHSHLRDDGAYTTREQQAFEERFAALNTSWTLSPADQPLKLGPRAVMVPDYVLKRGKDEVYLDVVGFWRKDWLAKQLDAIKRYAPRNLLLAVSTRLSADAEALAEGEPTLIPFATVLSPKKVIEAAEQLLKNG